MGIQVVICLHWRQCLFLPAYVRSQEADDDIYEDKLPNSIVSENLAHGAAFF